MKPQTLIALLAAAVALAACAEVQEAVQQGDAIRQTAQAAAPTLQAAGQTAQAAIPTLQAAAPTLQAQAEGLAQTAQAAAPTLEALLPTLEAFAPTLQAAAPTFEAFLPTLQALEPTLQAAGFQQTAEALATQLPSLQGEARQTAEAVATQGVGGRPADIPVAPRAQVAYTSADRIIYSTDVAPAGVRELYQVDMPAAGWAAVPAATELGDSVRLVFERPGRRATVTIAAGPAATVVEVSVERR